MSTTAPAQPEVAERPPGSVFRARARPPRPTALSASLTFAWRALLKIKHVPQQLFDIIAVPIVFTLVFTYMLGGALARSTGEYLQFLLPGVVTQTVLSVTMYTGSTLNGDVAQGVFDRFRSLPIWRPAILVGALLGDAVRYLIASTLAIAIGLLIGFHPGGGLAGVLLALLLLLVFAFSLSWLWTTLGLVLRTPQSVTQVSMTVLFLLTFASNIFVDPRTMPTWLQAAVAVNPVAHLVTAVRGLMHGTATLAQIAWVLLCCAALVAVFAPLTMHRYRHQRE